MRKRLERATLLMLILGACMSIHAQSSSCCTTIVIEYTGIRDHPIFPIILSMSATEAEWYKKERSRREFGHVFFPDMQVVPQATLDSVTEVVSLASPMKQPAPGAAGTTVSTILVVLAIGHNSEAKEIAAEDSIVMLGEIRKRLSDYPRLLERLSEMEECSRGSLAAWRDHLLEGARSKK